MEKKTIITLKKKKVQPFGFPIFRPDLQFFKPSGPAKRTTAPPARGRPWRDLSEAASGRRWLKDDGTNVISSCGFLFYGKKKY